jgi:hypothetical protein
VAIARSDRRYDTFSDAPLASDAAEFETQGVDIRAVKPDADIPAENGQAD